MAENKKSEKKKFLKTREGIKKFNMELRSQLKTALMAAFGFLIALVWRDLITAFVDNISKRAPVQGQLIGAIIVTVISVAGILVITKLLTSKEELEKK